MQIAIKKSVKYAKTDKFFSNQTSFKLDELIHNDDGIKKFRFAKKT